MPFTLEEWAMASRTEPCHGHKDVQVKTRLTGMHTIDMPHLQYVIAEIDREPCSVDSVMVIPCPVIPDIIDMLCVHNDTSDKVRLPVIARQTP